MPGTTPQTSSALARAADEVNREWVAEGRYPETASDEDEREFWDEVRRRAGLATPDRKG